MKRISYVDHGMADTLPHSSATTCEVVLHYSDDSYEPRRISRQACDRLGHDLRRGKVRRTVESF